MVFSGKDFYINNTFRFLFPILRMYGGRYSELMTNIYKLGVFIEDLEAQRTDQEDYLHIVIDPNATKDKLAIHDFTEWMTSEGIPWKLYALHTDPSLQVIMIRIPDKYQGCVGKFLCGDLTTMYSDQDIKKYFQAKDVRDVPYFTYCRKVLFGQLKAEINLDNEVLNF